MRVIIPVAGAGTRLRPLTYTVPKALIEIAGKPILGHVIDQVKSLEFSELIFITGVFGDKIEAYVRGNYDLPCRFIPQVELYGLGYAVHLGIVDLSEELLVVLGDTLVELDWQALIASHRNTLAVQEIDDPRAFGVVEVKEGKIVRLVEKPAVPPTNLAVVGVYYIRDVAVFHEATSEIIKRGMTTHGEIQLTDAFDLLLKKGVELHTFPTLKWYDCGNKETILQTNRYLLEQNQFPKKLEGSTIIAPSFIADGAVIEGSVVGPYVSIGDGAVVRYSQVADSIVAAGATVQSSRLTSSLIGASARVENTTGVLNIGELCAVVGDDSTGISIH